MPSKSAIDAVLSKACASGDVPGVVAMACDRNGTIYEGAFGVRELGKPQPMTVDTVMWIASMTKALTGAAAMQLVEQGKLDLDKPGGTWMQELAEVQVLEGFDDAGKPKLRPPKTPVTLRQLLTHTAGYGYDTWNPEIGRYQQATGLPPIRTRENAALRAPLLFDPGTRWNYGINIDFAGRLVEIASGQRLGAYLREHVTGPLGMRDTDFAMTDAMRARAASVHQRGKTGELKAHRHAAAGKARFRDGRRRAQLDRAGLSALRARDPQWRHARRPAYPEARDGRPDEPQSHGRAAGDADAHDLARASHSMPSSFRACRRAWGLTFQINEATAPTGRSAGSLSWAGLGNTYYWIDPVKGIGGVLATQILPFADSKALPLLYAFETEVYRSLAQADAPTARYRQPSFVSPWPRRAEAPYEAHEDVRVVEPREPRACCGTSTANGAIGLFGLGFSRLHRLLAQRGQILRRAVPWALALIALLWAGRGAMRPATGSTRPWATAR